jgi:hypothetical protein
LTAQLKIHSNQQKPAQKPVKEDPWKTKSYALPARERSRMTRSLTLPQKAKIIAWGLSSLLACVGNGSRFGPSQPSSEISENLLQNCSTGFAISPKVDHPRPQVILIDERIMKTTGVSNHAPVIR